jgi:hypothetical protein
MRQKIDDTTYQQEKTVNGDTFQIEIGDSKQSDFKPQMKLKRWDNEANFSVRLIDDGKGTQVEEADKVKYVQKDYEARFYQDGDAFELDILLKSKPKKNIFEFNINTKNLTFHYQAELTQEEIDSN